MGAEKTLGEHTCWGESCSAVKLWSKEASTRYFLFSRQEDDVRLACVWLVNSMTWPLHFWLEARMSPLEQILKRTSLTMENREHTVSGDSTELNTLCTSNTSPHQQLVWKQHLPLILLGSNRRGEAFSGEHFETEFILVLLERQRGFLIRFPLTHKLIHSQGSLLGGSL